ncbi:hypothetical protein SCUCBS95973_000642 [Sporothrix curviconia]|uniref:Glucose-methanol-choline oxidoreductase N-terminal domain-containing protein n=1 Tax=Sporothrix curviconia TaxID=1260050 RepID=A0ABP0AS59_9PEZI
MWPFASAYPERAVADVAGKTFDYIVVGGGAAGSVIASRLSEDPGVSVLLLERGPIKDVFMSRVPLMSQNFSSDWSTGIDDRYSEPSPAYNGRRLQLTSAEGLGGTTRINGMLVTRGAPGGYNEWADKFELEDWSWKDVEPYFNKLETSLQYGDTDYRGRKVSSLFYSLHIIRTGQLTHATPTSMEKACNAVGLPAEDDCNAPTASAQGIFLLDAAIYPDGSRVSAYRAYLNKSIALARQNHLTICTGAVATKLQFDDGKPVFGRDADDVRVAGVYVASAYSAKDGQSTTTSEPVLVKARREVIVCGGAFRSPQLLMLSGIGPREHLVDKHGIPCILNLAAVGQNLADHFAIPLMIEMPAFDTVHSLMEYPVRVGLMGFLKYLAFGSGMLSMPSNSTTIFARTSAVDESTYRTESSAAANDASKPCNVPDVEVMVIPVNAINLEMIGNPVHAVTKGRAYLTLYTAMVQLCTTGRLELVSATDATAHARVFYPELSGDDPASAEDWTAIRRAVRFSMRLAEEFVERSGYPHKPAELVFAPGMDLDILGDITKGRPGERPQGTAPPAPTTSPSPVAAKLPPLSKTWKTVSDAEIDAYARETGQSSLHFGCTCRMSKTAADGVVDTRLRVHGVKNLRVADASVFPKITSGHTMAPTLMVGERCADFIREDWAGQ